MEAIHLGAALIALVAVVALMRWLAGRRSRYRQINETRISAEVLAELIEILNQMARYSQPRHQRGRFGGVFAVLVVAAVFALLFSGIGWPGG